MGKQVHLIDPALKEQMAQALDQDRISNKTAMIIDLVSKGHEIDIAHKLVTGKDNIAPATKSNIKDKVEKWLVNSPKIRKLAYNALEDTLKMKGIKRKVSPNSEEEMFIYPTVSNRMAAVDMVVSRTEPVKSQSDGPRVISFVQINANDYRAQDTGILEHLDNGPEVECIDIKQLQD